MLKKIGFLIVFLFSFCIFTNNVNAKITAEGYCIYNFSSSDLSVSEWDWKNFNKDVAYINFMIRQTNNGSINYYYNYTKLITDPDDSEWKNDTFIDFFLFENFKEDRYWDKKDKFLHCPQRAWFKKPGSGFLGIGDPANVYFGDTISGDKEFDFVTEVTANSSIGYKGSTYYEERKCPNDIDWLSDEPSDEVNNEVHCLYAGYFKEGKYSSKKDVSGCIIMQLDYDSSGLKINPETTFLHWDTFGAPFNNKDNIYVDPSALDLFKTGICPGYLTVGPGGGLKKAGKVFVEDRMGIFYGVSPNPIVNEYDSTNGVSYSGKYEVVNVKLMKSVPPSSSIIVNPVVVPMGGCEDLLNDDMKKLLRNVVLILRIMIPILLNVFGIIDFGKAIFAGEEDEMKKAQSKFIKRLIIGIVIFLIPTILQLVLNIANSIWPVVDNSLCGIFSE